MDGEVLAVLAEKGSQVMAGQTLVTVKGTAAADELEDEPEAYVPLQDATEVYVPLLVKLEIC